jgi:hypothetical protein
MINKLKTFEAWNSGFSLRMARSTEEKGDQSKVVLAG